MFKKRIWLGIILSIILMVFSIDGFTLYYKYTQESGANFYVASPDKADALEDTNEVRQILDDLGNLLVHSKRDGSYPKDETTGGTLAIPNSALVSFATGTKGDLFYCSATNVWTKLNIGSDNQILVVATDLPNWETPSSDLLSDVAFVAMLDENEDITGTWTISTGSIEGVDATEFGYLNGVTSDIQTQFGLRYLKTEMNEFSELQAIISDKTLVNVEDGITATAIQDDLILKADFADEDWGDVTVSTNVVTIDNGAVTYTKIQNISTTDKILGRATAGAGVIEEIVCTTFARSILDDADEATFKATVNLEIGTDVLAYQVIGIADDNLVEIDDADAAINDYCKLTANGVIGRSYTEVKTDLGIDLSLYYLKTEIDALSEVEAIYIKDIIDSDELAALKFTDLDDTPAAYDNGKYAKSTVDGVVWDTPPGGYTNLTSFVDQTAWRVFYSNNLGDVIELVLGTDGQYLKSTGATSAPEFDTPTGAGDMLKATYDSDEDDEIDVAGGGTEKASWTQYCIPYLSNTTVFGEIPIGTAGQILKVSAGATGYEFYTPTKNYYSALGSDHTYSADADLDTQPVGESVVFGDLLYFNWTDKEWKKTDADATATMPGERIALESKSDGQTCLMLVKGYIRDDSAFEFAAAMIYASVTPGAMSSTAPTESGDQIQRVGVAKSADILFFDPSIDVGEI